MARPRKPPRYGKLPGKGQNYYIIDGKKTISTGSSDEGIAQKKLNDYILRRRGIRVPREHHEVLVMEALLQYGNHKKQVNPSAAERFKYSLRHLRAFWRNKTVAETEPEVIADYVDFREDLDGASLGTIRREPTDLRSALNHAVKTRRVKPIPEINLPSSPDPKDRWLRPHEIGKLLASAEQSPSSYNLVPFIRIGLWSGARKTAIFDLKWKQINFETGIIDFNAKGRQRTKQRRTHLPMSDDIRSLLLSRFEGISENCKYFFHQKNQPSKRVEDLTKGFVAACRRAKLKDVSPHTMRHTCATHMALRGEDIPTAAAWLA